MKNKIFIVVFAVLFGIVSPLLLTESFIENCNNLRRNYIVAEKQSSETIEIATKQWNKLYNKKEIFYKNDYYDIKNVVHNKGITTAILIKDRFEKIVKISINQKASKKEKTKKNSTFFAKYEILKSTKNALFKKPKDSISNEIVLFWENSFLFFSHKPPIT